MTDSNQPKNNHPSKNAHRKKKKIFNVDLKPEECEIVDKAKLISGQPTNRGVLMAACKVLIGPSFTGPA